MTIRTVYVVIRGADLCAETVAVYGTFAAAEDRAFQIISDLFDECGMEPDSPDAPNRRNIQAWNDWWDGQPDMHISVDSVPFFD